MEHIRIALCDDNRLAADTVAASVRSFFADKGLTTDITAFQKSKELLDFCERCAVDLVLLDIEMPELDGVRLGQILKDKDLAPEIIYISNREDQVFSALHVHPFGFVRKSCFLKDLDDILTSYIALRVQKADTQKILVTTPEGRRRIELDNILYFEGDGTYQTIVLADDKPALRIASRMKTLQENLEEQGFLRIHKGYLVNFRYVASIRTGEVVLKNGKSLPISRGKTQEMRDKYLKLCRDNGMMLF